MVQVGLTERVIFGQTFILGSVGVGCVGIWGKSIWDKGNGQCKGLKGAQVWGAQGMVMRQGRQAVWAGKMRMRGSRGPQSEYHYYLHFAGEEAEAEKGYAKIT